MLTTIEFGKQTPKEQKKLLLTILTQISQEQSIWQDMKATIDVDEVFSANTYQTLYDSIVSITQSLKSNQKEQLQQKIQTTQEYMKQLKAREKQEQEQEQTEADDLLNNL